MRTFITGLFILATVTAAQSQKFYSCTYTLKYPPKAIDSNISGIVIVEVDEDENGIQSNPIVIKGIGYGCDEEALRITNAQINCHNTWESRYRSQAKRKNKYIINFVMPADDDPVSKPERAAGRNKT